MFENDILMTIFAWVLIIGSVLWYGRVVQLNRRRYLRRQRAASMRRHPAGKALGR